MQGKERQSNFELLRIIAMLFIVTHHLLIKGASTCGYLQPYDYNKDGLFGLFAESLIVGGVNLFVLISGYFGIRHISKALLKLGIDLMVYGIIAYIVGVVFLGVDFSIKGLIKGIDIHNWFVVNFAVLVLTAPILESSLKNINRRTLEKWLVFLFIANIFFGWIMGIVNTDGYNYVNFVFLYFIARYIRLTQEEGSKVYNCGRKYGLIIWILTGLVLTAGMVGANVFLGKSLKATHYFGYNDPLVILSAISLFVVVSSLKIQSRYINIIATGMFGVFLMHTPPEIIPIRNSLSSLVYQQYGYLGIFTEAILLFICLSVVAIPVERLNQQILKALYGFIKK